MLPLFTAVILILALLDSVHAHFVWLERDGDGPVRGYFGEWIDDIREKTGGLLDRFKAPRVFLGANQLDYSGYPDTAAKNISKRSNN